MQQIGIKYGVICGLVYIILGLISLLLGTTTQSSPFIGILIGLAIVVGTFFVIFYGIKDFRDNVNNGALSIGEGVKLGALIALIAALLTVLFNQFYHYVVDPEYFDRMLASSREALEDRGMSDDQIDQTMKWTSMMQNPVWSIGFTIVWTTLWGLIKGLISGAILKKEPNPVV